MGNASFEWPDRESKQIEQNAELVLPEADAPKKMVRGCAKPLKREILLRLMRG